MKKTIILTLFCLPATFIFAQQEIPQLVKNTFASMYGDAEEIFWNFQEGSYVGNFQAEKGLTMVFIHPYGDWMETRVRLPLNKLPKKVKEFVSHHYKNADVTFSGEVIRANETLYRVESELGKAVVVKLLNKEGELLKEKRIEFGNLDQSHINLKPLPMRKNKPIVVKEVY